MKSSHCDCCFGDVRLALYAAEEGREGSGHEGLGESESADLRTK